MNAARVVDVTTITFILPLLFILHVSYKAALDRVQEQIEHYAKVASYEAALRSTADAVLVTDRGGQVTLINPAAERLTGWTERDAYGQPLREVFRALDPATRTRDEHAPGPDASRLREYVLVRRDGIERQIEHMQARVTDRAGEVIGTIITFRDISHRKAIEAEREALLESERAARAAADAANRLKDEFLTTLSHELRTPATGILGWVRLLKTGRMDDVQSRQALEALDRSARAQAVILDDLLDMSRIVRGTLQLELRPTDLREVLKGAMETVQPAIMSKSIVLHVDIPADVPFVQADPDRLRQVLWNLLSNAVKFTESGGSIRVAIVSGSRSCLNRCDRQRPRDRPRSAPVHLRSVSTSRRLDDPVARRVGDWTGDRPPPGGIARRHRLRGERRARPRLTVHHSPAGTGPGAAHRPTPRRQLNTQGSCLSSEFLSF